MLLPGKRSDDKNGQMPFALVAVALLLLTSYSVVAIAEVEHSQKGLESSQAEMSVLNDACDATIERVKATAVAIVAALAEEGVMDMSVLQTSFQERFSSVINKTFPLDQGGVRRSVNANNLSLRFVSLSDNPEDKTTASYPAYAKVEGTLNVSVSTSKGQLEREVSVDADTLVPFPLINGLLSNHIERMNGSMSELGRLVSYQLASLVQIRALGGVAARGNSSPLLTEVDVERALRLALALLERQTFRNSSDDIGIPDDTTMIDAAELMLHDDGVSIDMNVLFSQAVYALVDQTVLQWMEYLDFIKLPMDILECIGDGLANILDQILIQVGGDPPASHYLKERMASAGHEESEYRYLHGGDVSVNLPSIDVMVYPDGTMKVIELAPMTVSVPLPVTDIFDSYLWEAFMPIYREKTMDLAMDIQQLLYDLARTMSISGALPMLSLELDRFDTVSFFDTLMDRIETALPDAVSVLEHSWQLKLQGFKRSDPLALELSDYVWKYRTVLLKEDLAYQSLRDAIKERVLEAVMQDPSFMALGTDVGAYASLNENIDFSIGEAGIDTLVWNAVREKGNEVLGLISSVLCAEENVGTVTNMIAKLANGAVSGIPGLAETMGSMIISVLRSVVEGNSMFNGNGPEYYPSKGLELYSGDGKVFTEDLKVTRSDGKMDIRIVSPSEVRGGAVHYIGLHDLSAAPYLSTTVVRIKGDVQYTVTSDDGISPITIDCVTPLDLELRLPILSSWPLEGVQYSRSDSLGNDIVTSIINNALPMIKQLQGVFSACDALFSFIADMNTVINGFATKAMEKLASSVLAPIMSMQEAVKEGMSSLLGDALFTFLDNAGQIQLVTDFFGLRLELETNPLDVAMGLVRDLLRVTFRVNVSDVHLSVALRLLRMAPNDFYIIGTGNMGMNDWYVSLTIDPIMRIYTHIIRITGTVGGKGIHLEMPHVTQYETFSLTLSQIPIVSQFLSNIPLPFPGMKGRVDAGMELKYDSPVVTNLVINEVELNPRGNDLGREWVEIFNPLDHDVTLIGWSLGTGHGKGSTHRLPDMVLSPGEYFVYTFPSLTLYNGDSMSLPRGESIMLWDDQGRLIDSSPWLVDTYDDERSWKREHDAADNWVLEDASPGMSNGPRSTALDLGEWFVSELRKATLTVMSELSNKDPNLEGLADILHDIINILINNVLSRIAGCVVELKLFIQLGVSDISGTIGGGMELALIAGREFVLEGLQWMATTVKKAVMDIINPSNSFSVHSPQLLQESYIRLSVVAAVGLPSFISKQGGDERYELRGMVQMNLAAISSLVGKDEDNRRIGFGVMFSGIPGFLMPPIFKVNPGRTCDLWLMRGTINY